MKKTRLSRRTMLKGLGTISIGLPFIEEMMVSSAVAANSVPKARAFNVFFGLGIPAPLQDEGFDGVLEPLKPLSDKLLIMRGVDQVRCDESGINAHFDGATGAFTAEPPQGEAKSGGPSIDQVIRQQFYPNGQPQGVAPTVVAGTFFRRSRVGRYVHSYNQDGSVAATMQERPRDLFDRLFGTIQFGNANERELHLKKSVLDSVIDQYKYYTGNRSPLGKASRSRISDHLDRIREFEQRAFSLDRTGENDKGPGKPPLSKVVHGGQADPGGEGIDITLEELTTEWHIMADLYATAILMDKVRFGALTFLAAGERIRLTGDYYYNGEKRFEFNDAKMLNRGGSAGCSHEFWHQFNEKKKNEGLRAHAHMKMREVAYFLSQLADKDAIEANGKTVLENSLFTISTESGDGRHSDIKRELSGVFHAVSGNQGRIKTGQIMDLGSEGIDVYNTILSSMGVSNLMGPSKREFSMIDKILS